MATMYVEGMGTIFAEYDGYEPTHELMTKAEADGWLTYNEFDEEWYISEDAWKDGVRQVILTDMNDDGTGYSNVLVSDCEINDETEEEE